MSVKIFNDRLREYQIQTAIEEENAIKEIVQEICLAGLSRHGFFKRAAFQGGTCLRILYDLPRFSEDLDFILLTPNQQFDMSNFLQGAMEELLIFGLKFEIHDRSHAENAIKKSFLKNDSWGKVLELRYPVKPTHGTAKKISIKLELDSNPPPGSSFENKILNFPFPVSINTQDLKSLFAGKLHALLCRTYTKGRDWYDFLWYARKQLAPNYTFLQNALNQTGPWQGAGLKINNDWLIQSLFQKIESINWQATQSEVSRFISPHERQSLSLWSKALFLEQTQKIFKKP